MKEEKHNRLQELDRSKFEIVKGEPDIRGWDVRNRDGYKIGTVEELIVDADVRKVRYMVIDLDENELKLSHRKILIPIGLAELHASNDDVLLPTLTLDKIALLPDYDYERLTPDAERKISFALGRPMPALTSSTVSRESKKSRSNKKESTAVLEREEEVDPEFYKHEQYNLDNLYKNRLHEAPPVKNKMTEYERGLQLWERRSEGGILDEGNRQINEPYDELSEEERKELIKNRRESYRQTRYKS